MNTYFDQIEIPRFPDIASASRRIDPYVVRTPLLECEILNKQLGCRLLVKPEMLQSTRSFKDRGVLNKILLMSKIDRARGLVTYSSGNHAQAVAAAARKFGLNAKIVMPNSAPKAKIHNTKKYGAEVTFYDPDCENREEIAERMSNDCGAEIIKPYDDFHVISGQGTVGYEVFHQAKSMKVTLTDVLVPCGGGGLVGGSSIALKELSPGLRVWAVEPNFFDDTRRSLNLGRRVGNEIRAKTICDSLTTPTPGRITFLINSLMLDGGLCVSDQEVEEAMVVAYKRFSLIVEPGGAVALAAVLFGKIPVSGKSMAVVLSGGNVDEKLYTSIIKRYVSNQNFDSRY